MLLSTALLILSHLCTRARTHNHTRVCVYIYVYWNRKVHEDFQLEIRISIWQFWISEIDLLLKSNTISKFLDF